MQRIDINPMGPIFGSEIHGFDANAPLEQEAAHRLRQAFDQSGLLLFRDLDIDHRRQVQLCEMLIGKEGVTGEGRGAAIEDNFYISNKRPNSAAPNGRLRFHADTMWSERPFEVLSLYGLDVEEPSTPTIFVNAVHAWKSLPESLRQKAEKLSVKHTAADVNRGLEGGDVILSKVPNPPSQVRPIEYVHPRTGESVLYACEQMTEKVVDMDEDEGERFLLSLFAHMYDPSRRLEHHWRKRDLVVWDNLSLQHARPDVALNGPARTLRKVASPLYMIREDQKPIYSAMR